MDKRIFRAKDLMRITGMGRTTIYDLFKKDDFPTVYVGRSPTVSEEKFWEWYYDIRNDAKKSENEVENLDISREDDIMTSERRDSFLTMTR